QSPAALARAGADVDDVVGAAYRVLVMLDHHQRVAAVAELAQGPQQNLVVARVQAYRRFVEHIADALQIGAELRGQAYALGFAARQRGRATVQREVAQANILQKLQPAFDLGNQVARDAGFTANEGELFNPEAHVGHREARQVGNA